VYTALHVAPRSSSQQPRSDVSGTDPWRDCLMTDDDDE
jgi:hypothetical protein